MVHNREQLEALKRAVVVPSPIKVWLKIDTGMHRLGVSLDEVNYFIKSWKKLPPNSTALRFCSHFSRADELDSDYTQVQLDRFLQATKNKEGRPNHCRIRWDSFWPEAHLIVFAQGLLCTAFHQQILSALEFGLIRDELNFFIACGART